MEIKIIYLFALVALCVRAEDIGCTLNINHYTLNTTVHRCLIDIKCDRELNEHSKLNVETTMKVENDVDHMLSDIDKKLHIICEPTKDRTMFRIIDAAGLYLSELDLPLTWTDVHEVNISNNDLVTINNHSFGYLEDVTVLDLSHNGIERISPYAFVNKDGVTITIRVLLLQDNHLKDLEDVQFSAERSLEYLDVSNNNFETLVWLDKKAFNNIVTLNVDNNKLSSVGKHFHYMTKLKKVSMKGNSIKTINPVAFSQLISLNILDLSANDIETLQPSMFDGLHSLLYLNLSHNKIDGITEDYFTESGSLKLLDLSHNNLGQFGLNSRWSFAPIDYLLINDNNLSESDVVDILKFPLKVRKVSIGGNKFNCRPLVYKQAKILVHNNLKRHPEERDEDVEIECSTAQRVEMFGVSPRDRAINWNALPEYEVPWQGGSEFLREVLIDEHSVLIEIKLHNFSNKSHPLVDMSCDDVDPGTNRLSVATVAWVSVVVVVSVLTISFGYFAWKRYHPNPFGWRILGR